MMESRVQRVEVPATIASARPYDYASAFALTLTVSPDRSAPLIGTAPRTAEQWARAVFEGAPAALRWCMVFGWRFVLGLRLHPDAGANEVLGWTVEATASAPDTVTLAAASRFLRAENIVAVDEGVVVWVTVVRYDNRAARPLWAVAAAIHHRTIPFLLGHAARVAALHAVPS
jgi:hypothetical protein